MNNEDDVLNHNPYSKKQTTALSSRSATVLEAMTRAAIRNSIYDTRRPLPPGLLSHPDLVACASARQQLRGVSPDDVRRLLTAQRHEAPNRDIRQRIFDPSQPTNLLIDPFSCLDRVLAHSTLTLDRATKIMLTGAGACNITATFFYLTHTVCFASGPPRGLPPSVVHLGLLDTLAAAAATWGVDLPATARAAAPLVVACAVWYLYFECFPRAQEIDESFLAWLYAQTTFMFTGVRPAAEVINRLRKRIWPRGECDSVVQTHSLENGDGRCYDTLQSVEVANRLSYPPLVPTLNEINHICSLIPPELALPPQPLRALPTTSPTSAPAPAPRPSGSASASSTQIPLLPPEMVRAAKSAGLDLDFVLLGSDMTPQPRVTPLTEVFTGLAPLAPPPLTPREQLPEIVYDDDREKESSTDDDEQELEKESAPPPPPAPAPAPAPAQTPAPAGAHAGVFSAHELQLEAQQLPTLADTLNVNSLMRAPRPGLMFAPSASPDQRPCTYQELDTAIKTFVENEKRLRGSHRPSNHRLTPGKPAGAAPASTLPANTVLTRPSALLPTSPTAAVAPPPVPRPPPPGAPLLPPLPATTAVAGDGEPTLGEDELELQALVRGLRSPVRPPPALPPHRPLPPGVVVEDGVVVPLGGRGAGAGRERDIPVFDLRARSLLLEYRIFRANISGNHVRPPDTQRGGRRSIALTPVSPTQNHTPTPALSSPSPPSRPRRLPPVPPPVMPPSLSASRVNSLLADSAELSTYSRRIVDAIRHVDNEDDNAALRLPQVQRRRLHAVEVAEARAAQAQAAAAAAAAAEAQRRRQERAAVELADAAAAAAQAAKQAAKQAAERAEADAAARARAASEVALLWNDRGLTKAPVKRLGE